MTPVILPFEFIYRLADVGSDRGLRSGNGVNSYSRRLNDAGDATLYHVDASENAGCRNAAQPGIAPDRDIPQRARAGDAANGVSAVKRSSVAEEFNLPKCRIGTETAFVSSCTSAHTGALSVL